jgi:hypothetical protein
MARHIDQAFPPTGPPPPILAVTTVAAVVWWRRIALACRVSVHYRSCWTWALGRASVAGGPVVPVLVAHDRILDLSQRGGLHHPGSVAGLLDRWHAAEPPLARISCRA